MLTREEAFAQVPAAGVVRRGLAAGVDLAVVVATLYALQAAVALTVVGTWPPSPLRDGADMLQWLAVSLVVVVAYSAECWSRSGRTAGAAALGLRVLGRDGLPLRPAEAVMRAVACVIFPVGLLFAVVRPQRRSLQDIVFGSRVINGNSPAYQACCGGYAERIHRSAASGVSRG